MPVYGRSTVFASQIAAWNQQRFSLIPLVGGADSCVGKRPAIRWQPFTRRLPSSTELETWFGGGDRLAYGVVCGMVSGLVVLDLDDPQLAHRFARQFPHLIQTFTVQSGVRGTPHLYWRANFPVRTRSFPGGDLKADGSYVVGPGSQIAGREWQVLCHQPVRPISREELDAVLAYLVPPAQPDPEPVTPVTNADFAALYGYYVDRLQSRNEALFRVSCLMRDRGFTSDAVIDRLAEVHACQVSPSGAVTEAFSQRYGEALRTIRSVFTRPARRQHVAQNNDQQPVSRYPNAVREALLLRRDGAAIARTIEAAHLMGIGAGAVITEPMLCRLLKGIISRETIRKALAACYEDGQPVFCPPENPLAVAEIPDGMVRQNNAILSGGQKQTRQFILPDAATLCRKLGVRAKGSDPITLDDVRSSRLYRQALHQALLRRRPGTYAQALLASRLGLSSRSVRRYNEALGVQSQPTYHETPLLWINLDTVPSAGDIDRFEIRTGGQFLLDDTGKRWPLKREIAAQLLSRGHRVSHMRQGFSSYHCGDAVLKQAEQAAVPASMPPALATIDSQPTACPAAAHLTSHAAEPEPVQHRPNLTREGPSGRRSPQQAVFTRKNGSKRRFRQPLPDRTAERLACRIHRLIDDLTLPNARRLVDTYDVASAEAALRKFRWLKTHRHVTDEAGLIVTLARTSWLARKRGAADLAPAPRFRAEPSRKRRATGYVHPKRDSLWQSRAYRDWRADFFGWDDPLADTTAEAMAF